MKGQDIRHLRQDWAGLGRIRHAGAFRSMESYMYTAQ